MTAKVISVVAALIRDADGRVLLVRKRGDLEGFGSHGHRGETVRRQELGTRDGRTAAVEIGA